MVATEVVAVGPAKWASIGDRNRHLVVHETVCSFIATILISSTNPFFSPGRGRALGSSKVPGSPVDEPVVDDVDDREIQLLSDRDRPRRREEEEEDRTKEDRREEDMDMDIDADISSR